MTDDDKKQPIVVRLVTGDSVFGMAVMEADHYMITNPLALEEQESDDGDSTCVFMNRLERYSSDHTVTIHVDKVLFVSPMSGIVKDYYDRSLKLIQEVMDEKFSNGLTDAVSHMDQAIKLHSEPVGASPTEMTFNPQGETPERLASIRERLVLSQLAPSSKKTH